VATRARLVYLPRMPTDDALRLSMGWEPHAGAWRRRGVAKRGSRQVGAALVGADPGERTNRQHARSYKGEQAGPRRAPTGSPWPTGHGLQREASGVCWCGQAVLTCEAMSQWAAQRRSWQLGAM